MTENKRTYRTHDVTSRDHYSHTLCFFQQLPIHCIFREPIASSHDSIPDDGIQRKKFKHYEGHCCFRCLFLTHVFPRRYPGGVRWMISFPLSRRWRKKPWLFAPLVCGRRRWFFGVIACALTLQNRRSITKHFRAGMLDSFEYLSALAKNLLGSF